MPINIPASLPANSLLQKENIFVMEEERATHQDIRPLKIAILNLMPKKIETETINYGIISGNEKIVFIKVGADGNIKGYKNKYLKMAHRVHEKTGATVICASNPYIENGHVAADKEMILKVVNEMNSRL